MSWLNRSSLISLACIQKYWHTYQIPIPGYFLSFDSLGLDQSVITIITGYGLYGSLHYGKRQGTFKNNSERPSESRFAIQFSPFPIYFFQCSLIMTIQGSLFNVRHSPRRSPFAAPFAIHFPQFSLFKLRYSMFAAPLVIRSSPSHSPFAIAFQCHLTLSIILHSSITSQPKTIGHFTTYPKQIQFDFGHLAAYYLLAGVCCPPPPPAGVCFMLWIWCYRSNKNMWCPDVVWNWYIHVLWYYVYVWTDFKYCKTINY